MPKSKILAWETDSDLNPTGKQRIFISDSCRKVARQIAFELGGECGGTMVYLADGKRWASQVIEKLK